MKIKKFSNVDVIENSDNTSVKSRQKFVPHDSPYFFMRVLK